MHFSSYAYLFFNQEEHVMSHFEVDNDDPNEVSDQNSDEEEETTLSLEVNDVLCK